MDFNTHTIVMVEPGGWGGICHYTYNLSQALAKAGNKVVLISGGPYELADLPRCFHLEACLDSYGPYLDNWIKVQQVLSKTGPAVLHLQATFAARRDWLPMLVARLAGIPVVLTIHNVFPHDRAEREVAGMNLALDLIYRSAHALIVHGQSNLQELLAFFPLDPSRVVDIPHGDYQFARQDQTYSPSEARDRLGLPQEAPVALCFGAIREYKGIHLLIPAFARVHQNLPQARLMVVGKPAGTDAETYSRLIHQHNLEDAVLFKPEYIDLEEIGLYFAAADLAVYPYLKVYQSGALQLAYAFAKPVIVTAVGGLPETVEEGLNGHIIPPGSIDALATALEASLSAPSDTLRQMGQRSLELAGNRYGWPEIAQSTLQVYRQAVREA